MAHSFISQLMHCVFSTKERRPMITPMLQPRLFQYLGGIARENKMKLLAAGGVEDHVHLLVSFPSTISVAKGLQLIKGGSSKWIHETFPKSRLFAWQEGYGAFSIGISDIERTSHYINNQAEHHGKVSHPFPTINRWAINFCPYGTLVEIDKYFSKFNLR